MLKAYICDDNPQQRARLEYVLDNVLKKNEHLATKELVADNPSAILEAIKNESETGIFFLDIDLQADINGMELADRIREYQPRCFIVFITTHSEMTFMTLAYRVEAMDFILKDKPEELEGRICQCLRHAYDCNNSQDSGFDKNYIVKIGDKIHIIPYADIVYIEAITNTRRLLFHMKDSVLEFTGKLKDVENKLDGRFYRCHRAIIINQDYIKTVDRVKREVHLKGDYICPMSVRLGKGIKC